MTKIINFSAGPSAGKSTLAGMLYGWMKNQRYNVELAPEVAKGFTWRKMHHVLDDQLLVLGKQNHLMYSVIDQCAWVVTDSPLFLNVYYAREYGMKFFKDKEGWDKWMLHYHALVMDTWNMYDNTTFFVERGTRKFIQQGRNQNEEECKKIDDDLKRFMGVNAIPYTCVSTLDEVLKTLGFEG